VSGWMDGWMKEGWMGGWVVKPDMEGKAEFTELMGE